MLTLEFGRKRSIGFSQTHRGTNFSRARKLLFAAFPYLMTPPIYQCIILQSMACCGLGCTEIEASGLSGIFASGLKFPLECHIS